MPNTPLDLRPVDLVEIFSLVDNYSDVLLPGSDTVIRPALAKDGMIPTNTLLAEHGLSLLVKVHLNGDTHSVLLDTGYSNVAAPHNLKLLGLDAKQIEAIVMSHGHMDHTGALKEMIGAIGSGARVIVHPAVFLPRYLQFPNGMEVAFPPFPPREEMQSWGAEVVENKDPLLLCNNTVLVTGQIPRTTAFEKGFPGACVKCDGRVESDSFQDDQSLVISLGDRGLVVISGCAHAGIVNSVLYAQELTAMEKICAVIGGFHLTGPAMEPSIEPTVEAMKKLAPEVIVPMHCTGLNAIWKFSREMPEAFQLNSVGSKIHLSRE